MSIYEIKVNGWKPGFNKVGCTKVFQSAFGWNLYNSKRMTDEILAGGKPKFKFQTNDAAETFLKKMDDISLNVSRSEFDET